MAHLKQVYGREAGSSNDLVRFVESLISGTTHLANCAQVEFDRLVEVRKVRFK